MTCLISILLMLGENGIYIFNSFVFSDNEDENKLESAFNKFVRIILP